MSVLIELAANLQTAGFGTVGTDLFRGQSPTEPVNCVTLYEYAGGGITRTLCSGLSGVALEEPRVQIVVRNIDYDAARAEAEEIYQHFLASGTETTISGVQYSAIDPLQPPFLLGRDEAGTVRIATNYRCVKALST